MKKIAVAAMKGGTGKTTVSYNIACMLAKNGYKILCIDCDPQCNLSANFNLDAYDEDDLTICEIFDAPDTDPYDLIVNAPIPELPTLDVLPSNMLLEGTAQQLSLKPMREQFMDNYINKNAGCFGYYDYILFDTNPSMNIINQNAFFACDTIIMVSDPGTNSSIGANIFLRLWDNIRQYSGGERKLDALIVNNLERTNASMDFLEYIENTEPFSKIVLYQKIPHLTCFKDSIDRFKRPVFLYQGKEKYSKAVKTASLAIEEVVNELFEGGVL